jgi:hypothetical protein
VVWGRGIGDSFRQSFSIGRDNYFEMLALIALAGAVTIGLGMISVIGLFVEIFAVLPVFMFTICSYYLDKASIRKVSEEKPRVEEEEIHLETELPKARKMRVVKARVIEPEIEKPRLIEPEVPEQKDQKEKEKPRLIKPTLAKPRKKKAGIYVVARKRPIRIKSGAQKSKTSDKKSKTKKIARKILPKKAKKSRKLQ